MAVIQGPWKRAPEPPEPSRNHPAGRRQRGRKYCVECGRMFDPLRPVPEDKLCRDCRAVQPPPDPTLFDTP